MYARRSSVPKRGAPDATRASRGVYKPRRLQASPLFRLVSDHLHRMKTVYDDRFAREYGLSRPLTTRLYSFRTRLGPMFKESWNPPTPPPPRSRPMLNPAVGRIVSRLTTTPAPTLTST